jgi:hypothetical protein
MTKSTKNFTVNNIVEAKNFEGKYFTVLPNSIQKQLSWTNFLWSKLPSIQWEITYILSESSSSSVGGVGGTLELPCINAKF